MFKKIYKVIYIICTISLITMLISSCSNSEKEVSKSKIVYTSYTLEDSVTEIDSAIIDASKQAIDDSYNKKVQHFKKVYINIFEVKEIGKDTWEVRYRAKVKESDSYDINSFSFVTVEKQKSGSYYGYIINPGGPPISAED